jgi:hypothetical protein
MIIVQDLIRSPFSRFFHSSQSPAAVRSGEPSRAVKYPGCFATSINTRVLLLVAQL